MYICPICGFDQLRTPAEDCTICPSCGNQFGYDDSNMSHSELRKEWIAGGLTWHSLVRKAPKTWDPILQLGVFSRVVVNKRTDHDFRFSEASRTVTGESYIVYSSVKQRSGIGWVAYA